MSRKAGSALGGKKIIALVCLLLIAVPVFAFAATIVPCTVNKDNNPPVAAGDLPRCVNQIYIWSLGVASLLALLMIVIGGYYYMTASGNAERSAKGIDIIWSSVIGLVLLFGAYLLLNTINPDLVNFNANSVNCLSDPTAVGCPQPNSAPVAPTAPRAQ